MVVFCKSPLLGQVTFFNSPLTSVRKFLIRPNIFSFFIVVQKQARRGSNPQHPVLETGALPIELLAYLTSLWMVCFLSLGQYFFKFSFSVVLVLFLYVE